MADDVKLPPGYTLDEPTIVPNGYVLDNPANTYLGTSNGIPVYGSPDAGVMAGVENFGKQAASAYTGAAANANRLGANIFGLLDSAATHLSNATGLEKGGLFQHLSDWFRANQLAEQQQAAKLAGGQNDFLSQLVRGGTQGALELPLYMAAGAIGGPVAGLAGLGALQQSDQGLGPAVMGGLEGALMGGAMNVTALASRLIRGPVMAAGTYLGNRLSGADPTTALANAVTMGGMAAAGPQGATAADIARLNFEQAKQLGARVISLPMFQTTLNPVEAQAVAGMKEAGVPLTASVLTGNKFLRAAEGVVENTPLGAGQAAEFRRGTNEALTGMAQDIMEQAHPEAQSPESAGAATRAGLNATIADFKGQSEEAYKAAWQGRGNPQYTREVPVRTHSDGSLEMDRVNMPVDIGDIQEMARPVYDELDSRLAQTDKAQNAAFSAMEKLLRLPRNIPAWQAEPILSALKSMARTKNKTGVRDYGQGAAAGLVGALQDAIDNAVAETGSDALAGLRAGRAAHAQMMDVVDTAETLPSEPVGAFERLIWGRDSGIDYLRKVAEQSPDAMLKIGRALVQRLFDYATREGDIGHTLGTLKSWRDIGPKTKELLFPDPEVRAKLDALFKGMEMVVRKTNTSGTDISRQATSVNPLRWLAGWAGSKALFTPQGIESITQALGRQAGPTVMAQPSNVPAQAQSQFQQLAGQAGTKLGEATREFLQSEEGTAKIPGSSGSESLGPHGPIFRDFYHDAKGAVEKLKAAQGGEAPGALHHPELGDIDLIWGNVGDPKNDFADGFGLAHILAKHEGVVPDLQAIISRSKITRRSANRIQLEDPRHIAKVRLDWDGRAKKWLLTAFEKEAK